MAGAQTPVRYVVELQSPPVLAASNRMAAQAELTKEQSGFESRVASRGFSVVRKLQHVGNIVIVEAPDGSLDTLQAIPGVKRAFKSRMLKLHLDASIPLHAIDSAWKMVPGNSYDPVANPNGWNTAGAGVKIGIIDTGFDPTHPAFKTTQLTAPSGYPKWNSDVPGNKNLTNGKVIVVRSYGGQLAYDAVGHGTATAQVAAGVPDPNGPSGTLSGVAPAAWLGIYDVDSYAGSGFSDADILSAMNDAAADGMDVINMSLGAPDYGGVADPINQTYIGALNTLTNAGVIVVCSAGNEGPDPGSLASPGVLDQVVTAGAQQSTVVYAGASVTAVDGTVYYAASPAMFAQAVTAQMVNVTNWDSTKTGCTQSGVWPKAGVATGKVVLVQRGTCAFVDKIANAQTSGAAGVIIYNDAGQTYPDDLVSMDLSGGAATLRAYPSAFVGNTDGNALVTKAAAGSTVTLSAGLSKGDTHLVADFSSRGPDADLNIKPDLVAAGNSVVAAICTGVDLNGGYNSCSDYGYSVWDGTSFSSPLVAGAAAVLKAARPGLTLNDYRSLLVNTASPLKDAAGNVWSVQAAGAGSLNLAAGMQSSVVTSPLSLSFGSSIAANPVSQRTLTIKNLGSATGTYDVAVVSAQSVQPTLNLPTVSASGGGTVNLTVNVPAANAPGAYEGFITITPIGSTTPVARVPYWYGVPDRSPTRVAFDESPLSASAGSTTSMIVRFVDAAGIALPAPGRINVKRLSGSAAYGPAYLASNGVLTNIVTFPNVYLIDVKPSRFAVSGDTSTFRITCGNLVADFAVIVQ